MKIRARQGVHCTGWVPARVTAVRLSMIERPTPEQDIDSLVILP